MNWHILGAAEARQYFHHVLDAFIEVGSLEGKKVIDIGSGTGHLFDWLRDKGALSVTGIDPATKNIAISTENYPWATSVVATLNGFAQINQGKFDVAFCLLAFEHIENLDEAFKDIVSLLSANGHFYLIITDKDYHLSSDKQIRSKQFVSVEIVRELGNGAVETKTVRDLGEGTQSVMYDILRPLQRVVEAAEANSLSLFAEKILTSETPVPAPMMHVLGFRRNS